MYIRFYLMYIARQLRLQLLHRRERERAHNISLFIYLNRILSNKIRETFRIV